MRYDCSDRGPAGLTRLPRRLRAGTLLTDGGPSSRPFRGRPGRAAREAGGPMALALNIGKCTELGNYRENTEDSIDVKAFPDMTICLVADGMGGQAAGEVASKRAIEIVPRELKKYVS